MPPAHLWEVRPHQKRKKKEKKDCSKKEQRSERNPTLPVGTAEPQVGLTGKALPPDTVTNVSYIDDKEASLLRVHYWPLKEQVLWGLGALNIKGIRWPSFETAFPRK